MPDTTLDVYTTEEDAEYEALLVQLDQKIPTVSGQGFDFTRISGNLEARTAKAIVLHLALTGMSVAEIAERLGRSTMAVSRFLAEAICNASPIEDLEILRNFEMCKLDAQAQACWEQFRRSCEDEVTEVTTWEIEIPVGKDGDRTIRKEVPEGTPGAIEVIKRTRKGQSGSPGYQRVLLEIAKHRDKLLGLAKPTKVEVNKTTRTMQISEVVVRTREEVEAARAAGLIK